jgi:hypothetical protein
MMTRCRGLFENRRVPLIFTIASWCYFFVPNEYLLFQHATTTLPVEGSHRFEMKKQYVAILLSTVPV